MYCPAAEIASIVQPGKNQCFLAFAGMAFADVVLADVALAGEGGWLLSVGAAGCGVPEPVIPLRASSCLP